LKAAEMSSSKTYVWNPADYSKNSSNQFAWAKELIPKLKLKGDESIFDIGCGDGKITAEISRVLPNGKIVGVDNSSDMIKLADQNYPKDDYANLSFQVMDAQELTFRSEFDIAFSNAALHWIANQKPVLNGVNLSLKAGGRLLFQMAGKGNAKDILSIIDKLAAVKPWSKYLAGMQFPYGFFSTEEYEKFLNEAGLTPIHLALFPRDMTFPNTEGLAGWVRTTWLPYTQRIPQEMRDGFVKEIVTSYLAAHPADKAGTIHLAMMRLEVEAIKP
jgi:trans-aconitate 2-methyltransferase